MGYVSNENCFDTAIHAAAGCARRPCRCLALSERVLYSVHSCVFCSEVRAFTKDWVRVQALSTVRGHVRSFCPRLAGACCVGARVC